MALTRQAKRSMVLRFLAAPVSILGTDRVEGLEVAQTEMTPQELRTTGRIETLEAGLVLRSIGYAPQAVEGVPFDSARGVVRNDHGRVEAGVYTAGWAKQGPSGVIGTNKVCAAETVRSLFDDHAQGLLHRPDGRDLGEVLGERHPGRAGIDGWRAIDAHEIREGEHQGRPRVKLTRHADLITVGSARPSTA